MNEIMKQLKQDGIAKIKCFLNENEVIEAKKILKKYSKPKGDHDTFFSSNLKEQIFKLAKLQFAKFSESRKLLQLSDKKKLKKISDNFFNKKSQLVKIDGYCSPISNKEVLPWHTDQAYGGKNEVFEFYNPDNFYLKFLIYLSEVGPDNGCTSYIPGTHKVTYALRTAIYKKEISYKPYWLLKDLRIQIQNKENKKILEKYVSQSDLEYFLNQTDFINNDGDTKEFDFNLNSGDAIIIDEGGVHKGSKILKSERILLRYFYKIS